MGSKPLLQLMFCTVWTLLLASPAAAQTDEDEAFLSAPAAGEEPGEEPKRDEAAAEKGDGEQGEDGGEADPTDKWGGKKRDHDFQGFVSVLSGTGWYLVSPKDTHHPDKRCATNPEDPNEGEPVCTGRVGFHLDVLGGFAPLAGFEVFAIMRLGLEMTGDENKTRARQLGAGVMIYSPKDGLFKIGFGLAPLFDFTVREVPSYDFMIHVPIKVQFDFVPWFGAYLQVSPNISFITEVRLEINGGLGVQGRFP